MTDYQEDIFGGRVEVDPSQPSPWQGEGGPLAVGGARSNFNIFALTDAIGARDRKQAWILYRRALASSIVAEEIFWKVVWIIKSMLLSSKTSNYKETEMKEFPYNKAKKMAKNFSLAELEKLSEELVVGYHEARRGRGEIETFLEKFILNL